MIEIRKLAFRLAFHLPLGDIGKNLKFQPDADLSQAHWLKSSSEYADNRHKNAYALKPFN